MVKHRNRWITSVGAFVMFVVVGVLLYNSMIINLFGFHIRKDKIQDVIVYSQNHAFYVKKTELLKQISNNMASLQRSSKITATQYDVYASIPKVLIQTKNNHTYGGSILAGGSLIEANGYYWTMTPQLLSLLSRSIHDKQTQKLF